MPLLRYARVSGSAQPELVVYHAGAHKTGTSLIQKYLRDNAEHLQRHGISHVSRTEMNRLVGWGGSMVRHPGALTERIRQALRDSGARVVIVSHENTLWRPFGPNGDGLYPGAEERLPALREVLAPFPYRVVFYIRPQDQLVESYYLQSIHGGEDWPFDEWLQRIDLERMSWRPVLKSLERHLGRDNVVIGDFTEISEGQNEFLRRFLLRSGCDVDIQPSYRPVRNPSISDKGLRIARAANHHFAVGPEMKRFRKFLQSRFSNRDYPRPVLLTDAQRTAIQERYGAEYRDCVGTTAA